MRFWCEFQIRRALWHCEYSGKNGKHFIIKTINQSEKNVFVKKVELNGKPLSKPFITQGDIVEGCMLTFYMSEKIN